MNGFETELRDTLNGVLGQVIHGTMTDFETCMKLVRLLNTMLEELRSPYQLKPILDYVVSSDQDEYPVLESVELEVRPGWEIGYVHV